EQGMDANVPDEIDGAKGEQVPNHVVKKGKQIGDFIDMPSEAVKQGMDANVPDEIDGAKGEQ
nr:hypothetical protein [Tanacetum cinerariifolium]